MACDFDGDGWVDLAVANHKVDGDHLGWSAVWWNSPEGFDPRRVTVLPSSGPHGMRAVEAGNILDRGEEEYYLSPVLELPAGALAEAVAWEAEIPSGCWVRAALRAGSSAVEAEQEKWIENEEGSVWFDCGQPLPSLPSGARFVQVRLALGARHGNRTPRLGSLRVDYRIVAGEPR